MQPELAKLLELKAKLSEITDADPSGGKFVPKCPKVSQPSSRWVAVVLVCLDGSWGKGMEKGVDTMYLLELKL